MAVLSRAALAGENDIPRFVSVSYEILAVKWRCCLLRDTDDLHPHKMHPSRGRTREVLWADRYACLFGKRMESIVRLLIKGVGGTEIQPFQDVTRIGSS